jgi:CTP synthase (UTP-ammonia lyase)
VLGLSDAGDVSYGADPETALITAAHCELPEEGVPRIKGKNRVTLQPDSRVASIYGSTEVFEEFHCSNELNRRYQHLFESSELRVTGVGDEGEARVVELAGHAFFIGTLFLPQNTALEGKSHPLIDAFLNAAAVEKL